MTAEINGYISPYPVDPMPEWVAALRQRAEPVRIFAYGSLMWNPEMPFAERRPALLRGYHRSFCLYSRDYRGTPERPGLVLGLDRGGSCRGIAYRLPEEGLGAAIDRVWAREMAGEVYRMRPVTVSTRKTGSAPMLLSCAATGRTTPGDCRMNRWPASSPLRPAAAAPAAPISPTPSGIWKSSASRTARCTGCTNRSRRWLKGSKRGCRLPQRGSGSGASGRFRRARQS